jgi:hypothetical protein
MRFQLGREAPPMLEQVTQYVTNNILIVAMAPVVSLALLVWFLRSRRPRRTLLEKIKAKWKSDAYVDIEQMLEWIPPDKTGERRRALRRQGPATPIRVATKITNDIKQTYEGWVLDRASGGLCFATECELRVGSTAYICVDDDRPDIEWVAVTIRNCRNQGDFFLVGCEFQESLPLTIVLQFG